jgi:uncharacterized membrane protein YsdA (DUF1294 family)
MSLTTADQLLLLWTGATSFVAFALFGWDKWCAGRPGRRRVPESALWRVSAVGGWPGGMLGLWCFRHKSSKPSFQLKFAGAFFLWAALVAGALRLGGHW